MQPSLRRLTLSLLLPLVLWVIVSYHVGDAFQTKHYACCPPRLPSASANPNKPYTAAASSSTLDLSSTPLWSQSPADAESSSNKHTNLSLRDRLRKATGFSWTVFRATIRGITGISLTAIYASTIAVTGLWIRKLCSVVLSVFPSGFRYFLQPFLVLYYAPLFILRNLAGPTRQRAKKQHATVLLAWKEAVEYAEKTEKDGYWPVVVSDDGYFEMVAPPNPDDITPDEVNQQFSNAMSETVEHAMEVTEAERRNDNQK